MSRILISGSLAYDRIMDFDGDFREHIVPDKLHALSLSFQVKDIKEDFGGCSGNVAYNLHLLGEEPNIFVTAGSDFGRYKDYLNKLGISTDTIHVDDSNLTSVASIVTDRNNNQIAAFAMAAGGKSYGELPELKIYKCAMLGPGLVADTIAIARKAKQESIPYYCDPGQAITAFSADELREIISGAAGIFCNDYEFGLILEKTGWTEFRILESTPLLVVTLGAKGSRVISDGSILEISAVPISKLVDPTGAGDAHRAGFIKGIVAGLPIKECAQLASTVAAYAVESYGTQNQHFTIDELKARYKSAYGSDLSL